MKNERFEMNEEMMEQVIGGKRSTSPVNPYSPNSAIRYFPMGENESNEDTE